MMRIPRDASSSNQAARPADSTAARVDTTRRSHSPQAVAAAVAQTQSQQDANEAVPSARAAAHQSRSESPLHLPTAASEPGGVMDPRVLEAMNDERLGAALTDRGMEDLLAMKTGALLGQLGQPGAEALLGKAAVPGVPKPQAGFGMDSRLADPNPEQTDGGYSQGRALPDSHYAATITVGSEGLGARGSNANEPTSGGDVNKGAIDFVIDTVRSALRNKPGDTATGPLDATQAQKDAAEERRVATEKTAEEQETAAKEKTAEEEKAAADEAAKEKQAADDEEEPDAVTGAGTPDPDGADTFGSSDEWAEHLAAVRPRSEAPGTGADTLMSPAGREGGGQAGADGERFNNGASSPTDRINPYILTDDAPSNTSAPAVDATYSGGDADPDTLIDGNEEEPNGGH